MVRGPGLISASPCCCPAELACAVWGCYSSPAFPLWHSPGSQQGPKTSWDKRKEEKDVVQLQVAGTEDVPGSPWQSWRSGMAGILLPCPGAEARGSPPHRAAEEARKREALPCASCLSCRQLAGTSSAGPSSPSPQQPWERDSRRNSCAG